MQRETHPGETCDFSNFVFRHLCQCLLLFVAVVSRVFKVRVNEHPVAGFSVGRVAEIANRAKEKRTKFLMVL